MVTSGDTTSCSWETANGQTTVNGQPVKAKGSQTFTVRNTFTVTLLVTGIGDLKESQLIKIRVTPMLTSAVVCDFTAAPALCSFSGVGFTGESSVLLTAVDDGGIETEIGTLNVSFSDRAFENGTFKLPAALKPGSYNIRVQSPGFGVGDNEILASEPSPIVVPAADPPPDGTKRRAK